MLRTMVRFSLVVIVALFMLPVGADTSDGSPESLYYEDEDGKLWVEGESIKIEGADGSFGQFSEDQGYYQTEEGTWTFDGDAMTFAGAEGSGMFMSTQGPLRWPAEYQGIPQPEGEVVLQIIMMPYCSYTFAPVSESYVAAYVAKLEAAGFAAIDYPELAELLAAEAAKEGQEGRVPFIYLANRGELAVIVASAEDGFTVMFQPSEELVL